MSPHYEYLATQGLTDPTAVFAKFEKISSDEILSIGYNLHKLSLAGTPEPRSDGSFNFSAGPTLSGGTHPCANLNCRLTNMQRLATFSALYADIVLIEDMFSYFHHDVSKMLDRDGGQYLKTRLRDDIIILLNWMPLLKTGIVQINPGVQGLCQRCLLKRIKEESSIVIDTDKIESQLRKNLVKEISIFLEPHHVLLMKGAKNYVGSEAIALGRLPRELERYAKNRAYRFTSKEVINLQLLEKLIIRPVLDDLITQKYSVAPLNLSYLTDRRLEADIINALNSREDSNKSSQMLEGLAHQLPIISSKELNLNLLRALVDLRTSEAETFVGYRLALQKVILASATLNKKQFKSAIREAVLPELSKIDRLIKSNRDYFFERAGSKLLYNMLTFAVGMFIPPPYNIAPVITSLFSLKSITEDVITARNIPMEARTNDYYFLWQANRVLKY